MRANQSRGLEISEDVGSVSGEVQTLFSPDMPASAITARQNLAPSRY